MHDQIALALNWYTAVEWLYWLLLSIVLIAGIALNILGLPGLWLMLLGHILFGLVTGWGEYVGWGSVVTLFVLATLAEIVEFAAGAAGSAQAGGTKRGMAAAIIGGFVGGIVGSIMIPIPVLGTIIGAVGGSFVGATGMERAIDPDNARAVRIGIGAAKGRFLGIVIKTGFGIAMLVVSMIAALPIYGTSTTVIAAPPATLPTTVPTSAPTTAP